MVVSLNELPIGAESENYNTYKEVALVLHVTIKSTNHGCRVDHMSWLQFLE